VIGIVCIVIGVFSSFFSPQQESLSFQSTAQKDVQGAATSSKSTSASSKIVVDIEGAIIKGGIYHLNTDSRLQDALIAAGGLSENADRSFVEKHINLAQKLVDGQKIYFPSIGESASVTDTNQLQTDTSSTISGPLNINEATATQLDALPGIGQVTAQKIINGKPYSNVQELLSKKIVSSKVFGEIKDKVSTY